MITYRSFCTPLELFSLLVERFAIPTPHPFAALDPHLSVALAQQNYQQQQKWNIYLKFLIPSISFHRSSTTGGAQSPYQNLSPTELEQAFHRFRQEYQKPIQLKFVVGGFVD